MPNQHSAPTGRAGKTGESNDAGKHLNSIHLRGRLAAAPTPRELPSGDELWAFRLTVDRPPGERGRVDSIDCSTTRPRVQRVLARASAGDTVEVTGALRRRFWRGAAGLASRYEVQVSALGRVGRAAATKTAASGGAASAADRHGVTPRRAARRRSGA